MAQLGLPSINIVFKELGTSAIERGERKPTLETLYRISCALNVKMSDIVQEIEKRL